MKKYRTRWDEIREVEVERETEAFVVINGRRNAKRSDWENYFDTEDEAKEFILNQNRKSVEKHEASLARAREKLAAIEARFSPSSP